MYFVDDQQLLLSNGYTSSSANQIVAFALVLVEFHENSIETQYMFSLTIFIYGSTKKA